ncbi:hypothetical protein LJC33_06945 [Eubacteriales bacterium OttesenSCG-928-N13]|nr:hypothetical protein [Eubacteriales bacterium OttesenSCG-928-N13]
MNRKNVLAIILALLLALLPAGALAEQATLESGSITIRISDPVLTIPSEAEAQTIDLTGVGLQLGMAIDTTDMQNPNLLGSLMMIMNEQPILSAMGGMKNQELYALADGVTGLFTLDEDGRKKLMKKLDIELPADGSVDLADTTSDATAKVNELIESIQFTESPAESVDFYSTTGEYPRHSTVITSDMLKSIFTDTNIPDDASVDISYFTDEKNNWRIEGSLNNIMEKTSSDRNLAFFLVLEHTDENVLNGAASIANTQANIVAEYNFQPNAAFPGHYVGQGYVNLTSANGTDTDSSTPQASIVFELLTSDQTGDDSIADVLNLNVMQGETPLVMATYVQALADTSESYYLLINDNAGGNSFEVAYNGTITNDGDTVHQGALEMAMNGQTNMHLSTNIMINTSTNVDGKFPDTTGMEVIDAANMTEEQKTRATEEIMTLGFSVMGNLMTIPSLAGLIGQATSAIEGAM